MMTYDEARTYISNVSKTGSILGLDSIRALMAELSNVQDAIPIIHIAGTNGKGSVGAYLASILQEEGLHVGRYCSPAVFDPLEVWQYDGRNMSQDEYASIMSQVKSACDIVVSKGGVYPTVFEVETAAAFLYFYQKQVDVLLLETGMGGSTDATNLILRPMASVITTISMDHMQFLGDTLSLIAQAKGGIIKEECPVFSAMQQPEVEQVLNAIAGRKHTTIKYANLAFSNEGPGRLEIQQELPGEMHFIYDGVPYTTSMAGHYQIYNAALAIEVYKGLPQLHRHSVGEQIGILQEGIRNAYWPGRFEVIGQNPLFIVDGAHNEDAAKQLKETLENCFTNTTITYIIGVLADKEHEKMLRIMLPLAKKVYTVTPDNGRAIDGIQLAKEARNYHSDVQACATIEEAVELALQNPNPIVAFGSLSYLGDLKKAFWKLQNER